MPYLKLKNHEITSIGMIEKIINELEGETPAYVLSLEESNFIDDEDDYEIKKLKQINYNDIVNKNVVALTIQL